MNVEHEAIYPIAAALCAFAGAVFDVRSRRIPNFITGPALLFGLLLHAEVGGWRDMFSALAAGLICGAVFLIFYLAGGMGAGDVKLIAAVGCIAGMPSVAYLLVLTALAGGVMGIGMAVVRGQLKATLLNVGSLASHHGRQGLQPHPELNVLNASTLRLPYAVAIAAGCFMTLYLQSFPR